MWIASGTVLMSVAEVCHSSTFLCTHEYKFVLESMESMNLILLAAYAVNHVGPCNMPSAM
jgi:hypothetical protein